MPSNLRDTFFCEVKSGYVVYFRSFSFGKCESVTVLRIIIWEMKSTSIVDAIIDRRELQRGKYMCEIFVTY